MILTVWQIRRRINRLSKLAKKELNSGSTGFQNLVEVLCTSDPKTYPYEAWLAIRIAASSKLPERYTANNAMQEMHRTMKASSSVESFNALKEMIEIRAERDFITASMKVQIERSKK